MGNSTLVDKAEVDKAIKTLIKFFGVSLGSEDTYDSCARCGHHKDVHRSLSNADLKHDPEGYSEKLDADLDIRGTISITYDIVDGPCTQDACNCSKFVSKGTKDITK